MPNKTTKLLMIPNTLSTFGGGERFVLETAKMLGNNIDITIINPTSDKDIKRIELKDLTKEYPEGYLIKDINCYSTYIKRGNFLLMAPTVNGSVELSKAIYNTDVIYEVSVNPFLLASSIIFAKLYGKRFILDLGNPLLLNERNSSLTFNLLQGLLLNTVSEIHAQTPTQLKKLKELNYRGKIWFIEHPVWEKQYYKNKEAHKEFRCLWVGRMTYQKGLMDLRIIIERVIAKNRKIIFNIVGSGEDQQLFRAWASKYPGQIRYYGFVSDEILEELYQTSDLFINTSFYESPGIVFIEANAHGLPIIAWDVVGPKDVIRTKEQGTLIQGNSTATGSIAFAEAIIAESKLKKSTRRKEKIKRIINELYSRELFKKKFKEMVEWRA